MKLPSAAPVSKSSRFLLIWKADVLMALPPVDFLATCLARTIVGAEKSCFSLQWRESDTLTYRAIGTIYIDLINYLQLKGIQKYPKMATL